MNVFRMLAAMVGGVIVSLLLFIQTQESITNGEKALAIGLFLFMCLWGSEKYGEVEQI